jgi:hypothetical protein
VETGTNKPTSGVAASYWRVFTNAPFALAWLGVTFSYLTDRVVQLGLLELAGPLVDNRGTVGNDLMLFGILPFVFF